MGKFTEEVKYMIAYCRDLVYNDSIVKYLIGSLIERIDEPAMTKEMFKELLETFNQELE